MSLALTSQPGTPSSPAWSLAYRSVSTRKLIIAALVTGLAILVAFAIQVTMVAR